MQSVLNASTNIFGRGGVVVINLRSRQGDPCSIPTRVDMDIKWPHLDIAVISLSKKFRLKLLVVWYSCTRGFSVAMIINHTTVFYVCV